MREGIGDFDVQDLFFFFREEGGERRGGCAGVEVSWTRGVSQGEEGEGEGGRASERERERGFLCRVVCWFRGGRQVDWRLLPATQPTRTLDVLPTKQTNRTHPGSCTPDRKQVAKYVHPRYVCM